MFVHQWLFLLCFLLLFQCHCMLDYIHVSHIYCSLSSHLMSLPFFAVFCVAFSSLLSKSLAQFSIMSTLLLVDSNVTVSYLAGFSSLISLPLQVLFSHCGIADFFFFLIGTIESLEWAEKILVKDFIVFPGSFFLWYVFLICIVLLTFFGRGK